MIVKKPLIFWKKKGKKPYVDKALKVGGFIGAVFAGVAYLLTSSMGFDPESLTYILYLYIALGVVASLDLQDIVSDRGFFDRVLIVAEEEEQKLKKVFSDEEYRIDGTVEKVES